jgi:hypothetical protein
MPDSSDREGVYFAASVPEGYAYRFLKNCAHGIHKAGKVQTDALLIVFGDLIRRFSLHWVF